MDTEKVDTIAGVWKNAIVLSTPGKETTTRRVVYMNPYEGFWSAGIIFSDHSKYTQDDYYAKYRSNSFEMKAYFVNEKGTKVIKLEDVIKKVPQVEFPTQKAEMDSFRISNYNF